MQKPKVLIVDDEPAILLTFKLALVSAGFDVVTSEHPEAGFEIATKAHASFDVIVMDQFMPDIEGTELIERIRCYDLLTPILLMSASKNPYSNPDETRKMRTHFEPKPVLPERLREIVEFLVKTFPIERPAGAQPI